MQSLWCPTHVGHAEGKQEVHISVKHIYTISSIKISLFPYLSNELP